MENRKRTVVSFAFIGGTLLLGWVFFFLSHDFNNNVVDLNFADHGFLIVNGCCIGFAVFEFVVKPISKKRSRDRVHDFNHDGVN